MSSITPEEATILCDLEERAAHLSASIGAMKVAFEFQSLAAASDIGHIDRAMAYVQQLDDVTAECQVFNTRLRWLVARLRMRRITL